MISARLRSQPTAVRTRFLLWSALMLGMALLFAFHVAPRLRIETDILALLPRAERDAQLDAALDAFTARLARRQIFLIGAPTTAAAKLAARGFARELQASGAFASVQLEVNADALRRFEVYRRHRAWLLSPADAAALQAGESEALARRALRAAFTPAGFMQPLGVADDPLGLLNDFLRAQTPASGAVRIDGSMLLVERDGESFALIISECNGSPFASVVQERVLSALEAARSAAQRAAGAPVRIVSSGAVLHAAAAAQRAQSELSTFGMIESIAVVLLLWTILGALRPIALGVLTLSLAALAAVIVVHYAFGAVHVLTLVFGSSLIGGVIDYSIHFFADRFHESRRWSPADAVRRVGPPILLGLAMTLLGYLALALVPFPGLQQIALFCMTGLVVGCGAVLCLYPVLTPVARRAPPQLGPVAAAAIDRFVQRWRWRGWRLAAGVALALAAAGGLARVQIQDDVRALQQSPPQLVRDERQVRELLGSGVETRFFVVTADSEQALLLREQRLTRALDALIAGGAVASYEAVSRSLPPLASQQAHHDLLAAHVYSAGGLLERVMGELGFPEPAIERRRAEFLAANAPLTPQAWLRSPAAETTRHLWLGRLGERYASVVTLGGIRDAAALAPVSAGLEGVRLVDSVAEASEVLRSYRRAMSALLVLVYAVAGAALAARFGRREAPRMLLPSIAAAAMTLGLFGWLGAPVNLFTLLALWLVLGLSIDYGIFLRFGAHARTPAVLSVTLSACTTLLAFGLLAFSATPFIHTIGLTLACAIALSWLFVLFTTAQGPRSASTPQEAHYG